MTEGSEGRPRADDVGVVDAHVPDDPAGDADLESILPDLTEFDPELADLMDLSGPPPEPLAVRRPHPTGRIERGRAHRTSPTTRPRPAPTPAEKTAWSPPVIPRREADPSPSEEAGSEIDVPEFMAPPAAASPRETAEERAVDEAGDDTHEHDMLAELVDHAPPGDEPEPLAQPEPPVEQLAPDLFASDDPADRGRLFPGGDSGLLPDAEGEPAFIDRIVSAHERQAIDERPAVADDSWAVAEDPVDPLVAEPVSSSVQDVAPADAADLDPSPPAAETESGPPATEPLEAEPAPAELPAPPPEPATDRAPVARTGEPDGFAAQIAARLEGPPTGEITLQPVDDEPAAGEFALRAPAAAPDAPTTDRSDPMIEAGVPATAPPPAVEPAEPISDPDPALVLDPTPAPDDVLVSTPDLSLPPVDDTRLGPAPCLEPSPVADLAELVPVWRRHLVKTATIGAAAAAVVALLLTNPRGDSDKKDTAVAPEQVSVEGADVDPNLNLVAEAAIPLVDVYESPDTVAPKMSLEHPTEVGGPLVFLVKEQRGEWLHVFLPVRPNGSSGWVKANQVRLSKHDYRVVVKRGEHRLELHQGDEQIFAAAVAIGTRDTPTPGGTFYIKELLKPPDPDTVYGNFAFGLSGFSNVLESFNGGEGVIGIHGTNDPSAIGQDVSAGCIRMSNEDMLELVGTLPLGTPVEILP